jgi:mono/diheme cytochrome c family protein
MRKAISIGASLAVLMLIVAGTVVAQQGDPTRGKALWSQNLCKNCHGENAEGKLAFPLAGTTRTLDEVITQVRTPRANMPAFNDSKVGDQDLADMFAYWQTLQKPVSFAPLTYTAQPGDTTGKLLFNQKRCVGCHGDGAGLVKTRFSDQGRTVTQDAVITQLRTPFRLMPMFNDTQVTDDQAAQIATYLASLASPPGVSFQMGFQQLAGMIPNIVGNPLENERVAANGDALQRTTSGMMVWRKSDNWTAFTDGSRSWINGPQGLQVRDNGERFDWEKAR